MFSEIIKLMIKRNNYSSIVMNIMICRYLEHVLQEIETKAPQLAKQQEEYQQMVEGQQRLAKLYSTVSTYVLC